MKNKKLFYLFLIIFFSLSLFKPSGVFAVETHSVTYIINGLGWISISYPSGDCHNDYGCGGLASCTRTCEYPAGDRVYFAAQPTSGQTFLGWVGDCLGQDRANCSLYIDSDKTVHANFSQTCPAGMIGSGISEDPCQVVDWSQLDGIRLSPSAKYILMNNLNSNTPGYLAFGSNWVPIGYFLGDFNGNSHIISDLVSDSRDNTVSYDGRGLFGLNMSGNISNLGLVNVNVGGRRNIGALAGSQTGGTISSSYSTGNIIGYSVYTGSLNVGGLVGLNDGGVISNSYSAVNISGQSYVGGLVGRQNSGEINNSYSFGNILGSSNKGGLVGAPSSGLVSNSFWDIQTSNQNTSAGGIGTTTEFMKSLSTFGSWNIATSTTNINNGYPFLSWQAGEGTSIWSIHPISNIPPADITIATTDCVNATVSLSWTAVPGATNYKIYKNGTFSTSTASTSVGFTGVLAADSFQISTLFGVTESARSAAVPVMPAGSSVGTVPTLLNGSLNLSSYRSTATDTPNLPVVSPNEINNGEDLTIGQPYNFLGNALATTSNYNKFIKMDYYSQEIGNPNWIKQGGWTPIVGSISGAFSIPFTATSSPDNKVFYYVEAYPYCIGDFKNENSWIAGLKTYNVLPPVAPVTCGSADGHDVLTVPQGTLACPPNTIIVGMNTDPGPWTWRCKNLSLDLLSPECHAGVLNPLDVNLTCSVSMTPVQNPVNINTNTTWTAVYASDPSSQPTSVRWTIRDSNGTTTVTSTVNPLNRTFTSTGQKTVQAEIASTTDVYGLPCTATTTVVRTGGVIIER